MKHLATITDKDITGSDALTTAEPRIAVSVVLFDKDNNIALQYTSNHGGYMIIGGGINPGEDLIAAAKREVLEEAGCNCEIICEVGSIFENLAEMDIAQDRYHYIARVVGEKGELQLTEDEISWGASVRWFPIEKALQIIEDSSPELHHHKFIRKRDIIVLTEVIKNHAHQIGGNQ